MEILEVKNPDKILTVNPKKELLENETIIDEFNIEDERGKIVENDDKILNYDEEEDYEENEGEFKIVAEVTLNDIGPNKSMFSIKPISNIQSHSNYKLSRTTVDLNHPGNINGVPTVEYDLSKLVDEFKPWKKPGADTTDYFNYGFTEETWLLYCDKQKNLRLAQDNTALKTLSGFQNLCYPLSGSHIHLGMNRNNNSVDLKNKQNDIGMMMGMGNKISTIPVQTGCLNMNQGNNLLTNLTNPNLSNNTINHFMAAAAMAIGLQNPANPLGGSVLGQGMDSSNQYNDNGGRSGGSTNQYGNGISMNSNNGSWLPKNDGGGGHLDNYIQGNYNRGNSCDSMRSNEDYGERKPYIKTERRRDDRRPRDDRRERSPERRKRSRSRERNYESRHSKRRRRSSSRNKHRSNNKTSQPINSREASPQRSSSRRRHKRRRSRSNGSSHRRHRHRKSSPNNNNGHDDDQNNGNLIDNVVRTKREAE